MTDGPSIRTDDEPARAIVAETCRRVGQPAGRIDDDPRGLRAFGGAHRQPRIVRERGADADDDGIDQGAQPMQMEDPGRSIDVMGVPGDGGDAAIERLADLADRQRLPKVARMEHCAIDLPLKSGGGR